MARLNTTKVMKQCKKIAAEQAANAIAAAKELDSALQAANTISPEHEETLAPAEVQSNIGFQVEVELETEMSPLDLAEYLADFLEICRDADSDYQKAVEAEQFPNSAIQDVLHAAEFAPSSLNDMDLVGTLHALRTSRRDAKKNLEVTDLFKQWAERNQKATRDLSEVVGAMRKIIRRQPSDFYRWKTDVVGEKDQHLVKDEDEAGE